MRTLYLRIYFGHGKVDHWMDFERTHPVSSDSTTTVPRSRFMSLILSFHASLSPLCIPSHSVRIRRAYDRNRQDSASPVELSQTVYVIFCWALACSMATLYASHRLPFRFCTYAVCIFPAPATLTSLQRHPLRTMPPHACSAQWPLILYAMLSASPPHVCVALSTSHSNGAALDASTRILSLHCLFSQARDSALLCAHFPDCSLASIQPRSHIRYALHLILLERALQLRWRCARKRCRFRTHISASSKLPSLRISTAFLLPLLQFF